MTKIALVCALLAFTVSGCAQYQPSQAECFSFAAGERPCEFHSLEGAVIVGDADG